MQAIRSDLATGGGVLQLPGLDVVALPSHMVSNSFALGPGDISYVVTSMALHAVVWKNTTQTLSVLWSANYSTGQDPWFYGRLGPGSGSSPTVMGTQHDIVVITDGQPQMHVLFYDAASGVLLGRQAADFGGQHGANSTSEQSVVVLGNQALVVNNWFAPTAAARECEQTLGNHSAWLAHLCPGLLGQAAYGMQLFEIDRAARRASVVWVNPDVSCTTSIPVVGAAPGVSSRVFCLGKRGDTFTIESVDWASGLAAWHTPLGAGLQWNSLYAATELQGTGLLMGTMEGVLYVRDG
eukprot:m.255010 g.255010  ORF g.255010 m.255010 type:complete len:295 (+) comp22683_c0_seq1:536-1420(+)